MTTARLYALAYIGNSYHTGQWSRGYRLMCLATSKLERLGITNIIDQWDCTSQRGYDKRSWAKPFRSHVARELNWLRKYRWTL